MKLGVVLAVVALVGCAETGRLALDGGPHDVNYCTDEDGDGFGEGCAPGGDCNDTDPTIHQGCLSCVRPAEGCACESSATPVSCYLEPSSTDDGTIMCHEGTRYCRSGSWSACESIFSYPKPATAEQPQAVINPTAGLEKCSDCRPSCFLVRDNLNPVDGGLGSSGSQTKVADGGGLSLDTYELDAGTPMDAGSPYDAATCMVGAAPDKDCDGILDQYDPYPTKKPFKTTNPTLFLDLAAGATGTGAINLAFYLNSADVYFLLDQTGSMDAERANLVKDLTMGTFITDSTYKCSDYDYNGTPNNELKDQGIVGAVRCYIRDANFGVGFFREIPFDAHSGFSNYFYGHNDEIAFRNLQDITTDLTKITAGAGKLQTVQNLDWEEAAMPALYSLVSGSGMYFGTTKPSIPARADCPADTWGYPCFRKDAIPIVVLFTDAPSHNGPTTNTFPYDANYLNMSSNTAGAIDWASGNEAFGSATDTGNLTNSYVSFYGDTSTMASNLTTSAFTCAGSGSAPDAFYKFTLDSTKTVTLSTEGSEFDTVLSLWRGLPSSASAVMTNPSGNDSYGNAYNFNDVTNKWLSATGSTSSLASNYLANDLGCSAYSGSPDAAFTFAVSQPTRIALDTAGSTIGTSVSLFSGTPLAPSYTSITSTNDTLASPVNAGPINGALRAFSGTTNNGSLINANYSEANIGCGTADGSPDAVYEFSVGGTGTTKVRVSAEDSTLDTVLALVDNASTVYPTTVTSSGNDIISNATTLGPLENKAFTMVGNTSTLANNYAPTLFPSCNAGSSRDSVTSFSLTSTKTVQVSTSAYGGGIDTVVGLFKNAIASDTTSYAAAGTFENLLSAGYPGPVNGKHWVTTGGSTNSMAPDYTAAQFGACSGSGVISGSPDAVYKLHLNSDTTVRLDTAGSSFDTVMGLYSALPDQVNTNITTGDTFAGRYLVTGGVSDRNQSFTNTAGIGGFAPDFAVNNGSCAAHDAGKDAIFEFNVATDGNYQIDTIGSGFDTVLGVFQTTAPPSLPTPTGVTGTNADTTGTAPDVGTITSSTWKSYTGTITTSFVSNQADFSTCGANTGARDVFFKFTVTGAARTISIDTIGSGFDTVLAVYSSSPALAKYPNTTAYCNDEGAAPQDRITQSFSPGVYYAVIKGKTAGTVGAYKITFKDSAVSNGLTACDDNNGGGTASKVTLPLTAGTTYYAVVKAKLPSLSGTYKLAIRHNNWADAGGTMVTCNDNNPSGGTTSFIERPLTAGDYWVVLKGKSTTGANYVLSMQDETLLPDGFVACSDDAVGTSSSITQTLGAGTYHVVVKSKNSTTPAEGKYVLSVRDTAFSAASTLACDYNTGPSGTSAIERDLTPGTYRVVVKGKLAGDKGNYKLQIRDMTALPAGTGQLACNYNGGAGGKSYLEQDLPMGTYTVLLKGDSPSASGGYKLSIRDASNLATSSAALYCDNDGGFGTTSKLASKTLPMGTYYVGVKGNTSTASGLYQVHFGAGATPTKKYVPPTWDTTIAELKAKKVRVIPILSCNDDPDHGDAQGDCKTARTQYTALANATGALGQSLSPLIFDINGQGVGLSGTVVQGIASLAQYLEMNVSARVVFDPDANPGFLLSVKAVDTAGDGCDGIVGAEHQKCLPGATPRFEISFTNPLASPVPLNSLANDPKGGYNFRAELIANDEFIVDEVPIYIIPEKVVNVPPPPKVYSSGTYTQSLSADGCAGNTDLPDWNDLTWNATVPNGTSVSFGACSANRPADLTTCMPTPICTVTGGNPCSTSSPCPTGSFCSAAGNCNKITGGVCSTNANCPSSATCLSGVCTWAKQPIDVGEALGPKNGEANLRVAIGLTANTTTNVGPTVKDWSIDYVCKNAL